MLISFQCDQIKSNKMKLIEKSIQKMTNIHKNKNFKLAITIPTILFWKKIQFNVKQTTIQTNCVKWTKKEVMKKNKYYTISITCEMQIKKKIIQKTIQLIQMLFIYFVC